MVREEEGRLGDDQGGALPFGMVGERARYQETRRLYESCVCRLKY